MNKNIFKEGKRRGNMRPPALPAFLLAFIVLLAPPARGAEEFDAVVTGVSGAATLRGTDELSVYNCKLPTQAPPKIEFDIARPAQCTEAFVVSYERYDFEQKGFVDAGQLCIVPPSAHCIASVPIKLGGMGKGEVEVKLLRLSSNCHGISYEREFVFKIVHQPDPVEAGVVANMESANATMGKAVGVLAGCGTCCSGAADAELANAGSSLENARTALAACEVANASGQAGLALQNAQAALALAEERLPACMASGNITAPSANVSNVSENGTCALPCLPDEEQRPFPECSCVKRGVNITVGGNITGNVTVSSAAAPPQPQKPCGLFALLVIILLAWRE